MGVWDWGRQGKRGNDGWEGRQPATGKLSRKCEGGTWRTSGVCFPLSSAPGEGEFLEGIHPHRSRKQPEKDSSNNSWRPTVCSALGLQLGREEFVRAKSLQWCPTLWNPVDCSPPGSSVYGILQARILEWVAIPFPKGSS